MPAARTYNSSNSTQVLRRIRKNVDARIPKDDIPEALQNAFSRTCTIGRTLSILQEESGATSVVGFKAALPDRHRL